MPTLHALTKSSNGFPLRSVTFFISEVPTILSTFTVSLLAIQRICSYGSVSRRISTYKIQDLGGIGEVHIADEVVAIVAGLAATDVDGVASMAGNITNELVSKLGKKNLSKGVRVTILEGVVTVDLSLNIE